MENTVLLAKQGSKEDRSGRVGGGLSGTLTTLRGNYSDTQALRRNKTIAATGYSRNCAVAKMSYSLATRATSNLYFHVLKNSSSTKFKMLTISQDMPQQRHYIILVGSKVRNRLFQSFPISRKPKQLCSTQQCAYFARPAKSAHACSLHVSLPDFCMRMPLKPLG